ncbi:hypothetical protein ANCDUO_19778 [Ancylostoma duodenale]|uniref:Uncharacterized protein n=1 Tax=Ancylostoma duodenale TaxID=51022 RepID=A0A0C2FZ65_9BILA|nr:hypothetical protein ANCDUO_19778 [Ancylostoma duodenale]
MNKCLVDSDKLADPAKISAVIVNSDKDLRDALNQSKGKLKLHTTLADGQVLSAAEMAGRQTRSHSVPPAVVCLYFSGNSRFKRKAFLRVCSVVRSSHLHQKLVLTAS